MIQKKFNIEEEGVECEDFKAHVADQKPDHVPTPQNEYFIVPFSAPTKAVIIGLVLVIVWAVVEFALQCF